MVQPPGLDVPLGDVHFSVDLAPPILLLDAAPEVLLLDAAPVTIIEVPTLDWSVPTLDWSVPETPTLVREVSQVPKPPPNYISYDLYFNIIDYYPAYDIWSAILARRPPPFVPAAPADDPPSVWRYEFVLLTFRRWCLRKGTLPWFFGYYHKLAILSFRGFAAFWLIWTVLWGFTDYYADLRDVWRFFQARRHNLPFKLDEVVDRADAWFDLGNEDDDGDRLVDEDDDWVDEDDNWVNEDDASVDDDEDAWVTEDEEDLDDLD